MRLLTIRIIHDRAATGNVLHPVCGGRKGACRLYGPLGPACFHPLDERGDAPGDRLLLCTDGAEEALWGVSDDPQQRIRTVTPLARLSRDELLLQLADRTSNSSDGAHGKDDITLVIVDIEP